MRDRFAVYVIVFLFKLVDPDTGERRRRKPRHTDSDSDSELSGMEGPHGDMDLASSHSSDDDEEEYPWSHAPKHKALGTIIKYVFLVFEFL